MEEKSGARKETTRRVTGGLGVVRVHIWAPVRDDRKGTVHDLMRGDFEQ